MFQKQDLFQASSAKGREVPVQWELLKELGSITVNQTGVSGNKQILLYYVNNFSFDPFPLSPNFHL